MGETQEEVASACSFEGCLEVQRAKKDLLTGWTQRHLLSTYPNKEMNRISFQSNNILVKQV